MNSINELAAKIYQNNINHGFYDSEKNIGEMLCLIHCEVSEALEAHRKSHYAAKTWIIENNIDINDLNSNSEIQAFQAEFNRAIKNSFEDELADIMIRVMDLAAFSGINLEYHIKMKMAYNELREYKHGKAY